VFFMGAVPAIDLAGVELLADLRKTLQARGIAFQLAEAHGDVRDALMRSGFDQEGGKLEAGQSVDRVIATWRG
jgi:anti-anti-sigma regulatory factor